MKTFILLSLVIFHFSCSVHTKKTETIQKTETESIDPFSIPIEGNTSKEELLSSMKEYGKRGFMVDFIEEHLTVIAVKGDSIFIITGTPTFQIEENSFGVIGGTRKTILDSPRNVGYPKAKLRTITVSKPFFNSELGHMTTPIEVEWE